MKADAKVVFAAVTLKLEEKMSNTKAQTKDSALEKSKKARYEEMSKFAELWETHPKKAKRAAKICKGIFLTLADALIVEEEFQVRVGTEILPSENSNLDHEQQIIRAIVTAKPGTKINLLRDGYDYTDPWDTSWEA